MPRSKAKGFNQPAIDLDVLPLLPSTGKYEDLLVRFEKLPRGATLSKGHNNGDGSWSVRSRDLSDLIYFPADGDLRPHTLFLRIIGLDGDSATVLGSLDMEIKPARAPSSEIEAELVEEIERRMDDVRDQVSNRTAEQIAELQEQLEQMLADAWNDYRSDTESNVKAATDRLGKDLEIALKTIGEYRDKLDKASTSTLETLEQREKHAETLIEQLTKAADDAAKSAGGGAADPKLLAAQKARDEKIDNAIKALSDDIGKLREATQALETKAIEGGSQQQNELAGRLAQLDAFEAKLLKQVEERIAAAAPAANDGKAQIDRAQIDKAVDAAIKPARDELKTELHELVKQAKGVGGDGAATEGAITQLRAEFERSLKTALEERDAATNKSLTDSLAAQRQNVVHALATQTDEKLAATVAKLQQEFAELRKADQSAMQAQVERLSSTTANAEAQAKALGADAAKQLQARQDEALAKLSDQLNNKIEALSKEQPGTDTLEKLAASVADIQSNLNSQREEFEQQLAALKATFSDTDKAKQELERRLAEAHAKQLDELRGTIAKELKELALENASDISATQIRAAKEEVADSLAGTLKTLRNDIDQLKAQTEKAAKADDKIETRLHKETDKKLAALRDDLVKAIDKVGAKKGKAVTSEHLDAMRSDIETKIDGAVKALAADLDAAKSQLADAGPDPALEQRLSERQDAKLAELRDAIRAELADLPKPQKNGGLSEQQLAELRDAPAQMAARLDEQLQALRAELDTVRDEAAKSGDSANGDSGLEERLRAEQVQRLAELKDTLLKQLKENGADAAPLAADELKRAQQDFKAQVEDRLQSLTNALKAVKSDAEKSSNAMQSAAQLEERLKTDTARRIAELNDKFSKQFNERIEAEAKLQHAINTRSAASSGDGASSGAELETRVEALYQDIAAIKARPAAGMSDLQDARRNIESKLRSEQVSRFSETREEFTKLLSERLAAAEQRLIGDIEDKLKNANSAAEKAATDAGKNVEAQGNKLRDRLIGVESRAAAAEHTAKGLSADMAKLMKRLDDLEWAIDKASGRSGSGSGFGFKRLNRKAANAAVAALCLAGLLAALVVFGGGNASATLDRSPAAAGGAPSLGVNPPAP